MRNYKRVLFVLIGILIFSLPVSAISEEKPTEDKTMPVVPDTPAKQAGNISDDDVVEPIPVDIRYLFAIDAKVSGRAFGWVDRMLIDEDRGEVYFLDRTNGRIVITDRDGVFLYQFDYMLSGLKNPTTFDIDPKRGDIYAVDGSSILVLNYRGAFKRALDISSIPDSDKLVIQSIDVTTVDGDDRIYIGDNNGGRVIVLSIDGKFIKEYRKDMGSNFAGLYVYGGDMIYLDSGGIRVYRFGLDGELKAKFGKLSSLLGGLSIPITLAVDTVRRRILVVDVNRLMVVVYNMKGNPLYEFGGPGVFKLPRGVAVDRQGRIYVADATNTVRVFEVKEVKEEKP